jgi:hypothetical protein
MAPYDTRTTDAWAFNTPPRTEYVVVRDSRGRPRHRTFERPAPQPGSIWDNLILGPNREVAQAVRLLIERGAIRVVSLDGAPNVEAIRDHVSLDGAPNVEAVRHGRTKAVLGRLSEIEEGKRQGVRHSEGGLGRGAGWIDLDSEKVDFLRVGGWFVEKASTTGLPVGRPAKGILNTRLLLAAIWNVLMTDDERFARVREIAFRNGWSADPTWSRGQLREIRAELFAAVPNANTEAISKLFGVERRTVQKSLALVRSPNSPKGGESMSTLETINSRLGRIEALLEEHRAALERNSAEVFQTLYAFRFGETPAESWERVLDEAA